MAPAEEQRRSTADAMEGESLVDLLFESELPAGITDVCQNLPSDFFSCHATRCFTALASLYDIFRRDGADAANAHLLSLAPRPS